MSVPLDDDTRVDAGWVVGTDGAHSVVHKALGVGFPGVPLVERFLLADVHAELERRPIAADVLASTSGVTEIVMGGSRVARFLRDRIAVPLMNRGWVQRLIAKKASQLQVSYRDGLLGAGPRRWLPGLRPGDRVPDRDGMYDALAPAWVLLGPESMAQSARRRLGEVVTLASDGHAMLVRPDGHLAWRGSDEAGLQTWLDTALGRRAEALTP